MNGETAPTTSFESRIGRSVSLDQAATMLGVSRRTIYNRIRESRLQTIRTAGGSQRVLIDSLDELLGDLPSPRSAGGQLNSGQEGL